VIEAGGARMAILVCKDLARLHAFSATLHAHAAIGHASEPDDIVVFALDAEPPRVAHERSARPAGTGRET
jgi:hypothetical protein